VAIRGERIVAVGSSAEVGKLAGKETRVLDLQGRVVIPGINDAHVHHAPDPKAFELPLQPREPSWSEVQTALPKTESVLTLVGGRVVYDAGILKGTSAVETPRP
jgi:predicted amidohydrolase YtcJ